MRFCFPTKVDSPKRIIDLSFLKKKIKIPSGSEVKASA